MANHGKHTDKRVGASVEDYRADKYVGRARAAHGRHAQPDAAAMGGYEAPRGSGSDDLGFEDLGSTDKFAPVDAGAADVETPTRSFGGVPADEGVAADAGGAVGGSVGGGLAGLAGHAAAPVERGARRKVMSVLIALAVVVGGVGVAFGLYANSINDAMKLDSGYDDMKANLTRADLSKPFYMLLVGSDWRENSGVTDVASMSGDQQRADVIMLARIDCPGKKVTILTVPRDTPYRKDDGSYCKINELYNEGRGTLLVPAVEALTGIKISHYAEIYFSDFEKLIDALGGIELDVPIEIDSTDVLTDEPIHVDAGKQLLNGKQAMAFSRERKSFEGNQDEMRQFNIRTVVNAMMHKITKISPIELPNVLYSAVSCVRTDLQFGDILLLANAFHDGITMYTGGGPADGNNNGWADGMWLCYENPAGWERVMRVVDMGEDPGKVSYGGDVCTIAGTDNEVISAGEPATDGLGDDGGDEEEEGDEYYE